LKAQRIHVHHQVIRLHPGETKNDESRVVSADSSRQRSPFSLFGGGSGTPEQFTQDPQRLARFEREAKLLASLNHPNIAAIHSFEQSDDIHFSP